MFGESIKFELVDYRQKWKELEGDWHALYKRCDRPCLFYHPLFLTSTTVLPNIHQPTHLMLGMRRGDVVFGLPVKLKKVSALIKELSIYSIRTEGFDHLVPLDSTVDRYASSMFLKELGKDCYSVFSGESLDGKFAELLELVFATKYQVFKRQSFRCPFLTLPATEDELLGSLSKKFRLNLKRSILQAKSDSIRFRVVTSGNEDYSLERALQNLQSVHADRSDSRSRSSKFLTPDSQAFHARLCKEANLYPEIIHFFEAIHDDRVIGSLYGYLNRDEFYFYQSGFYSEYRRYSLGSLLIYRAILHLINRNARVFDFLRGADKYKFNWTNSSSSDFLVLVGMSLAGRGSVGVMRLKRAMKRSGKKVGAWQWVIGND